MANRDPRPVDGGRVRVPTVPVAAAAGAAQAGIARSAEETANLFGEIMRDFSDRMGRAADAAAQREGADAGVLAGRDPHFTPRADGTLYGEAFDDAGLTTALNRTLVAVDTEIDVLAEKHARDPAGLREALTAAERGRVKSAMRHPRLAATLVPQIEAQYARKGLGAVRAASERLLAERRQVQLGALQEALVVRQRSLEQDAYRLGLDAAADEGIAGQLAEFDAALQARGPDGRPLIDDAKRRELVRDLTGEVMRARVLGQFDLIDGVEQRVAFLKELEQQFKDGEGAGGAFGLRQYQRLEAELTQRLAQDVRQAEVARRTLAADVKSVVARAQKGYAAPADELAALKTRVAATGDAELASQLDGAEDLLVFQTRLRAQPPAVLDEYVRQETAAVAAEGASEVRAARLDMARRFAGEARSALRSDPLGWADRVGVLDVAPLDLSTPEAAGESLRQRVHDAEAVARHFGQAPTYLRPAERQALAATLAAGGDAVVGVAATLAEALGPQAVSVLAELGDEAPTLAQLGGLALAEVPHTLVREAADGMALRSADGYQSRRPSRTDSAMVRSDVVGQAFTAIPRTEAPIMDLAEAIYEARAVRAGITEYDERLFTEALHAAVGGHQRGGVLFGGFASVDGWSSGRRVIVPPSMPRERFDEALSALTDDDLSDQPLFHATGERAGTDIIRRGHLVSVGVGAYAVFLDDPADPAARFPVDAQGRQYVLRLTPELTETLVQRVGVTGAWGESLGDLLP